MADSWDDAALVDAFNQALGNYQKKHNTKKNQGDNLNTDNAIEHVEEEEAQSGVQEEEKQNTQQPEQANYDPYQQYPYPYPYPQQYPQPWGYAPVPYPAFFPGTHCCHSCPCVSKCSTSSEVPSFDTLKAAVHKAISELPDKSMALGNNSKSGDVLLAWFNAGFRTASFLSQMPKEQ